MLSEKQKEAVRFANEPGFMCLSIGAWRSGKSYSSAWGFGLYTQRLTERFEHLILGRKLRSVESAIVEPLREVAIVLGVPFDYKRSEGKLYMGNQVYHLIAANDARSVDRLYGLTIHSAIVDEAGLLDKDFFTTAIGRCTYGDSKMWVTQNPRGPLHWLKVEWRDTGKVDNCIHFVMTDNPSLAQETMDRAEVMFTGVYYDRMVLGLDAAAEGLVYPTWRYGEANGRVLQTVVGMDYGVASPSALVPVHTVRSDKSISYHVPEVLYLDGGSDKSNKTDEELADTAVEFCNRMEAKSIVLDPSAISLRNALIKHPDRNFSVRKANNDVKAGIRTMGSLLTHGKLTIAEEGCEAMVDEFSTYEWDGHKEDTPVKVHDHLMDACRYGVMDVANKAMNMIRLPGGF